MEIRVDKGRGDEVAEKRVCMGKVLNGGDEELRRKRKRKSKKEAALSSFEPEVNRGRSGFVNNGESSSLTGESLGLNGISINLDGRDKIIRIPKKPRGYVGSKSHVSKPSELSSSMDQISKLKSECDVSRVARVRKSECAKIEKEEDLLVVENGNVVGSESSAKKGKRKHRKKNLKDLGSHGFSVTNMVKAEVDDIPNVSDDEENLEQNAARMLSSRFDPRCTGPSSNSKCALIRTGSDIDNHLENLQDGLVSPRTDSSNRALRPRNDFRAKGTSRKRRHFYEVAYRDEDAQQFLNQRIKVFWPLDKIWYYGLVNCYDEKTKRHHVKYDDRDMEWICLQNERFKLLLLPSEVKNERSKKSVSWDKTKDRTKTDLSITDADANTKIGVYTDSEPISSWLARSVGHSKSSSGLKKLKISHVSPNVVPPLSNETANAHGNENVGSREIDTGDVCILPSTGSLANAREEGKYVFNSTSCKEAVSPVVYFRRRFHKKEISCSVSVNRNKNTSRPRCVTSVADSFRTSFDCMDPDKMLWSIGDDGILKLNMDLIQFKELSTYLNLQLQPFIDYIFGVECFKLFGHSLLLQYGKIVKAWPKFNLEMLLVNTVVGLRLFLFEGCLKQALDIVFHVLTLLCEPNEPQKFVCQEIPATSIRFKLNCVDDHRKKHVFAFYSFSKLKCYDLSYLDSMLEQHCLFTKQLSPTECTTEKVKELECGMKNIQFNSIGWEPSFQGLRNKSFQGAMPIGVSKPCNGNRRQFAHFGKTHGMFLPFAISFSAAPTWFFNLHLKLLMESCTACIRLRQHSSDCSPEHIVSTCKLAADDCSLVECCCENGSQVTSVRTNGTSLSDGSGRFSCSKPQLGTEAATLNMDGYNINSSQYPKNQNLEVAEAYTCSSDSRISEADVVGKSLECGHHDPELEGVVPLRQPLVSKDHAYPVISGARSDCYLNDISVEIPAFDLAESKKSPSIQRAPEFYLDMSDGIICSPNPIGPNSLWPLNGINSRASLGDISLFSPDVKTKIIHCGFGNGPKKPRTQVQYALPSKGSELSSKHKAHNQNGHPYKRIRRASEKKMSDASKSSQRNLDSLACDANLLVTLGDKGWREFGAHVVLELADHNEYRLTVKISGSAKYSHKVHNNLQSGSTNRYTHAMMWKGGKDWALEFPDRSQWVLFKVMHEECYNQNVRAASVKNIPIPGVRLIEEFDNTSVVSRFSRSSLGYFRQLENDVEMAMNPAKIFYDMDSDDEQWILDNKKSFQAQEIAREVTDELFEKTMDTFEKVANARQSAQFTFDEVENIVPGVLPMEVTKAIFHHWQQKRQRIGIPLIRHLQRPAWERYQEKMKEWDELMTKANTFAAHGGLAKAPPKPTMFAFCLKPRGLEVLNNNKGSKHRYQRRYHVTGNGHCNLVVQDGFHAFGRRLNSFTYGDDKTLFPANSLEHLDTSPRLHASTGMYSPENVTGPGYLLNHDVSDRNIRPKHHKKKSKKLATFLTCNNLHMASRTINKRNGVQHWNFGTSVCPTPNHQQSDVFHRYSIEHLSEQDLEEFRLRDASGAAKHASNFARFKRDRARRLLYRSDIVIHKAVSALMIADAVKASYEDSYGCQMQGNKSMRE